jgi:predicted dehydrogenase
MKKITCAFFAAGARNRIYARNLLNQYGKRVEICALCDIDKGAMYRFKEEFGLKGTKTYLDHRELMKNHPDIDGVFIAPPNHMHEKIAVDAMKKNFAILLEKPIAHTAESCMNIARAYNESSSRVTVGFVLRYTPFYKTVIDLVRNGAVGTVKVIHADEMVGPVLSSVFFRTWRAKEEYTGGLMLEKCCHDIDLINAILGVDPVRVSAFAGNNHYGAREGYGPRCGSCTYKESCAFSTVLWNRLLDPNEDNGENNYVDFDNDLCVYNNERTIQDRQSQIIEYEGNIHVQFDVALGGPETRRTIDITGTEGRIRGDFRESRILLHRAFQEKPEEIHVGHEESGHGGGDSVLVRSFMESIENTHYAPEAGLKDGLKSAMLVFLCDRARDEGKVLPVSYLEELNTIRD